MNKLLFLTTFLLFICNPTFAQKACPTNFSIETLPDVNTNLKKWHGRIVAFDAKVIEVREGYMGKPFYKVDLGGEYLWVGGHGKSLYVEEGRTQRILGYLSEAENDEINKKYNPKKYFIISLGFIDMGTKQGSVLPAAKLQFEEWMKGSITQTKNN